MKLRNGRGYAADRDGHLREETTDELYRLYRKTLALHAELVEHLLSEAKLRKREADRAAAEAFKRRECPFTDAQLQELFDQAKVMGDFHSATEFAREMAYRRENA